MPAFEEPTLEDHLAEAQAAPLNGLYERAAAFLRDYDHPKRLHVVYSIGGASVGEEVEGEFYRLTEHYRNDGGYLSTYIPGLVAVERVPDEAVTEREGESYAADHVGERLWRLRPARIQYAGMGYDDVFPAAIEDLARTRLERHTANYGCRNQREGYDLPHRNYVNELEGADLEQAQRVTAQLLDKLAA